MDKKRIAILTSAMITLFFMGMVSATSYGETFELMPGPEKKAWLGKEYYATYTFDKKPQMGTVIVKVAVFDREGKKDSSFQITGDLDMPSMKGAHASGKKLLKQNKQGDYLMALRLVMPGEWEVQLIFEKDQKVVYRGSIRFRV